MDKAAPLHHTVSDYCAQLGQDRLLVQAAGGNVSWKADSTLWIKASGTWLADACRKDVFVPVDLNACQAALARADFGYVPQALAGHALRPSIETMLHALMPQQVVVHLHPVDVVAHLVRANALSLLTSAMGDMHNWALVPYQKPGAELARAVSQTLQTHPDAQILFLRNHGLILGAETVAEVDELLQGVLRRLHTQPLDATGKTSAVQPPSQRPETTLPYRPCTQPELNQLACDAALSSRLTRDWALCPDHVVFLGARALCVEEPEQMQAVRETDAPPFIFVQEQGVWERTNVTPAQLAQLQFYLDVLVRQPQGQALVSLGSAQIAELLNWDAEKYRQLLNQSVAPH